jgi:MOSC domain-containing protein YiiM
MSGVNDQSAVSLDSPPVVHLLSVNVGQPQIIGKYRGQPVRSGIKKRPVDVQELALDWTNLAGDGQADLRVHGGPDKAVYAYPSEHLPLWSREMERDPGFGPGAFGENLTVRGWFEDEVRIGDIWAWGDALLQVVQPRFPCYKLTIAVENTRIAKPFIASGRTGWYLRVLQPGTVPVVGPITVIDRDTAGVTVLDSHRALVGDEGPDRIERVLAVEALAASWREGLQRRLAAEE